MLGRTLTTTVNNLKFQETSDEAGQSVNVALSPYTIWTLMALISEGAQGNTLKEIDNTLLLPTNKKMLRNSFQNLTKFLSVSQPLLYCNAIFRGAGILSFFFG